MLCMLCYVMLCYVMLCYVMLCYVMYVSNVIECTITHKIITEPNFTIFELFSVIPVLRLPNRIVSRISKS